jgi:hypothetical protein
VHAFPLGYLDTSTVRDNNALNISTLALTSDNILTNLFISSSYTNLILHPLFLYLLFVSLYFLKYIYLNIILIKFNINLLHILC